MGKALKLGWLGVAVILAAVAIFLKRAIYDYYRNVQP